MKKQILLLFILTIISRYSFALVDYTEPDNVQAPSAPAAAPAPSQRVIKRVGPPSNSASRPSGMFEISTSYHQTELKLDDTNGKVNMMKVEGHFDTGYNIYLDIDYWSASSDSTSIAPSDTGNQSGNPTLMLGFNWFEAGNSANRASFDFLAGMTMGQDDSDFATSRDDKHFGVETTKRFNSFILGLGYVMTLTGSPNENEKDIGNIQNLYATIGWMATPDIRFALEGGTYKISASDDSGRANVLGEDISFGYLSPRAILGLSSLVSLEFGGVFRTKRISGDELVDARLWNLNGSYGNSIFAGLRVSF